MVSNSKLVAWDATSIDLYQDWKAATFRFLNKGHPNTVSWSPTAQGACQTSQAIYQTPYHAAALRKPTFALFLWNCSRHCSRPFQGAPRYNLCICKIVSIVYCKYLYPQPKIQILNYISLFFNWGGIKPRRSPDKTELELSQIPVTFGIQQLPPLTPKNTLDIFCIRKATFHSWVLGVDNLAKWQKKYAAAKTFWRALWS